MWEVEGTVEFENWYLGLDPSALEMVTAAVDLLAEGGPGVRRPLVDTLRCSRHRNMKELRTGTIRIFFCFDPRRVAILLIGGSKRGRWKRFYSEMVPKADRLYDDHLAELRDEGAIPDA